LATVAMEIKKRGDLKKKMISFIKLHETSILNLFNRQKLPHTTVDIPTKFNEV
jgi:hypothetical protein